MAHKRGQHDRWILATSFALSILSVLYFLLLFPRDTTTVFLQYLSYISVALIAVLAMVLTVMLYRKLQNKKPRNNNVEHEDSRVKTIEQLIWRNRYVLQSQKTQLMNDNSSESREKWKEGKLVFARKHIFPVISEAKVPFEEVSELIEKSLRGAAIGGIRPPTYSVKSINR